VTSLFQRLLVQKSKQRYKTGDHETSKYRISMFTNSEALLCRFTLRTQRPFSDHITVTIARTASTIPVTWHNRNARSPKEAMELFWPWLQRVNQLRSFPSRSHLQGCPNVPQGTRAAKKCPIPTSHSFHNFWRNAIHFTRASTQRNNLESEMCAERNSDGSGAVFGVMKTRC
jgi:hypothetical protein